jgi:hypothetical protein
MGHIHEFEARPRMPCMRDSGRVVMIREENLFSDSKRMRRKGGRLLRSAKPINWFSRRSRNLNDDGN